MTQALEVRNEGGEVMPIEPTDAKAWELVGSVLGWMGDNSCYNYSEAFRHLGVAPASYYRAIKRPFVQGRLAERMQTLDAAVAKILDMRWPLIIANTVRIAEGDGREAVQAPLFLGHEKGRIQELVEPRQEEGPSEAALFVERFKEQGADEPRACRLMLPPSLAPGYPECPPVGGLQPRASIRNRRGHSRPASIRPDSAV